MLAATESGAPSAPLAAAPLDPPRRVTVEPVAARNTDFGDIGLYIARRLLALVVDLIGVTTLTAVGIHFVYVRQGQDPASVNTFFATAIYTIFALFVYLCVAEAYLGTTLGHALFNLRVQAAGGGRVGIWRALVRTVFLPFDLAVIGFVLAVVTPRRRRIGDFIGNTEVVNAHAGFAWPVVAIVILGGWAYAEYAFADGVRMAQALSNSAETYGPSLIGGQPAPPPAPTPLPERTPVPTEQPITVPTLTPSSAPASIEPAGGSASPEPSGSAGSAAPSSAAPSSGAPPSPGSSPTLTSPSPAPTKTT